MTELLLEHELGKTLLDAMRQAGDELHTSVEETVESKQRRIDADGLAGGPGRAIDAALKLGYDIDRHWTLSAGYRTLEGGADVEEVYAFAWLHYLAGSVSYRW